MDQKRARKIGRRESGFTLIEGIVGCGIFGVCFAALLTGLTSNVSTVKYTRETVRATQIMEEKFDTLRLYTWDQVNTPGFISNQFYTPFFPGNALTGSSSSGVTYTGLVTIAASGLTESYSSNLVQVTIDLYWPAEPGVRHAQMSTYVAKYGIQSYIYQ